MELNPRQRMYQAISAGDAHAVRSILAETPSVLTASPGVGGASWLHYAAREGHNEVVDVFLAAGLDINFTRNDPDLTPLNTAVCKGQFDTKHLLSRGANANQGRNLIAAINAMSHSLELVKLLVEHGADVNQCWRFGDEERGPLFNALSWATDGGREDIAKYLRSRGAVLPTPVAKAPPTEATSEIVSYFARKFGPVASQGLREIVPATDVSVVIRCVRPTESRNSIILFTTGMSDQPMRVPRSADEYRFAELMIELPAKWPLTKTALGEPKFRWPIDWLRKVAAYSHQEHTWLGGPFAIMANGAPTTTFAHGVPFGAMLMLAGYDGVGPIELQQGKRIQVYTLVPLYSQEKELEESHGLPELMRRFDQHGISRFVDVGRQNVASV